VSPSYTAKSAPLHGVMSPSHEMKPLPAVVGKPQAARTTSPQRTITEGYRRPGPVSRGRPPPIQHAHPQSPTEQQGLGARAEALFRFTPLKLPESTIARGRLSGLYRPASLPPESSRRRERDVNTGYRSTEGRVVAPAPILSPVYLRMDKETAAVRSYAFQPPPVTGVGHSVEDSNSQGSAYTNMRPWSAAKATDGLQRVFLTEEQVDLKMQEQRRIIEGVWNTVDDPSGQQQPPEPSSSSGDASAPTYRSLHNNAWSFF